MKNYNLNEGKTISIISYITWIGTLIAFIMNNNRRNSFASFHIRQAIGISLTSLINSFILVKFVDFWVIGAIGMTLFVLRIIGLIGAVQNEKKLIPFVGDLFQDWFKKIA